jgi:hypothetical protein
MKNPVELYTKMLQIFYTKNWKSKARLLTVFILLDGIALGALGTYELVPTVYAVKSGYSLNQCDFRPILATYNKIRYEGETFPIQYVIPDAAPWMVFQDYATSLTDPYNTYFKGKTDYREALHAGSVYDIDNGYYNIIDPTGYLFPEVNHSKMYERISVADRDKFLDFINRRQPDWKLPLIQVFLDWAAGLTFIIIILAVILYLLRQCFPGLKSLRLPPFSWSKRP